MSSRARLGKKIALTYKWHKTPVFAYGDCCIVRVDCINSVLRKTAFLRCHLHLKTINLPRQARDKHDIGKSLKKDVPFFFRTCRAWAPCSDHCSEKAGWPPVLSGCAYSNLNFILLPCVMSTGVEYEDAGGSPPDSVPFSTSLPSRYIAYCICPRALSWNIAPSTVQSGVR